MFSFHGLSPGLNLNNDVRLQRFINFLINFLLFLQKYCNFFHFITQLMVAKLLKLAPKTKIIHEQSFFIAGTLWVFITENFKWQKIYIITLWHCAIVENVEIVVLVSLLAKLSKLMFYYILYQ